MKKRKIFSQFKDQIKLPSMRKILIALLPLIFLLSGLAQAQLFKPSKRSISKRLGPAIEILSSDSLEGRLSGTDNEKKAAIYIANGFKELGISAAFDDSYFQDFEFNNLPKIEETSFSINGINLESGNDFYPLSSSGNCTNANFEALKVGYGITAPKLKHNDFDSLVMKGFAILVELGYPGPVHPHSKFIEYSSITNKIDYAINAGASAIIFYSKDDDIKDPSEKMSRNLKPMNIPVLYLTNSGLEKVNFDQDFLGVDISTSIKRQRSTARNVAAYIDNEAKSTVVIGAHYDHLGFGEEGGSRWMGHPEIHNGADDNASGTAALLEFGRYLKKGKYSNNNYLLVAFSGEELGLLGSKHLVNNIPEGIGQISYMLNMDMIGRLREDKSLGINGVGSSPSWEEVIGSLKSSFEIKTTKSGIGSSDHTSFYLEDIPAIHFFTGTHEDYHKPSDDFEKINFIGEAEVIRYMISMIKALDKIGSLAFTKTDEGDGGRRSMNFSVTLGIMPAYFYEGSGLKIDGVREGKPAALAGLKKDDIILQMGEMKISDIRGYMSALSTFKKGDKVKVKVLRKDQKIDLEVQF